jgi:hypothetical protein
MAVQDFEGTPAVLFRETAGFGRPSRHAHSGKNCDRSWRQSRTQRLSAGALRRRVGHRHGL